MYLYTHHPQILYRVAARRLLKNMFTSPMGVHEPVLAEAEAALDLVAGADGVLELVQPCVQAVPQGLRQGIYPGPANE